MNNKILKLITSANLVIAVVVIIILFLIYGNKPMLTDWTIVIGIRWIWVPVVLILFAAILYSRIFLRKKN